MSELRVVTEYVLPGGVSEIDLGGKRRLVRVCLGHIANEEFGLIAEQSGKIGRIPWRHNNARLAAIAELRETPTIEDEGLRAKLVTHVTISQYFEAKQ